MNVVKEPIKDVGKNIVRGLVKVVGKPASETVIRLFQADKPFTLWANARQDERLVAPALVPDSRTVDPIFQGRQVTKVRVSVRVEGDLRLLELKAAGAPVQRWRGPDDKPTSAYDDYEPWVGWLVGDQIIAEFPVHGDGRTQHLVARWEEELRRWVAWLQRNVAAHNRQAETMPAYRARQEEEQLARESKEKARRKQAAQRMTAALAALTQANGGSSPEGHGQVIR